MYIPYKAASWTHSNGGSHSVPLNFLPRRGPRGGRNIVVYIEIEDSKNYTTDGSSSLAVADFATGTKKVRIFDRRGARRYLSGFKLRQDALRRLISTLPADPSALGVSQTNQNRVYTHVVSFQDPLAHDPDDFLMPVDHLHDGGGIVVEMAAASDLKATGSPTIVSGTYNLTVYCREDFDYQEYCRDVVTDEIQKSDTALVVPVNGNRLVEAWACKEAAGGGTSVTTFTDATIELFGMLTIERAKLKQIYLSQLPLAVDTARDHVSNDKAVPLVICKKGNKWADWRPIGGDLLIRATSTLATPDILNRVVYPHDGEMVERSMLANGVNPRAARYAKTVRGTRRDLRSWGGLSSYIRWKAAAPLGAMSNF